MDEEEELETRSQKRRIDDDHLKLKRRQLVESSMSTSPDGSDDSGVVEMDGRSAITCGYCFENYSRDERPPVVLTCRDALCAFCVEDLKIFNQEGTVVVCPFCRKVAVLNDENPGPQLDPDEFDCRDC